VQDVQQARLALGRRLREIREVAHLRGKDLAESLHWQPSKVSKIERGKQTPTERDIRQWTDACGASDAAPQLTDSLTRLDRLYAEWRRQLRGGTRARQQASLGIEGGATVVRAFEPVTIPGLLQTTEYARHRLAEVIDLYELPNDIDEGVAQRMQRQHILYQPGRGFHFVITEAALRMQVCPIDVLAGQLDRLLALTGATRNVRLGVLPLERTMPLAPLHGFWIFDAERVLVETFSAELTLNQADEINMYRKVFDRLAGGAVHGSEARHVLAKVASELDTPSP